MYRPFTSTTQLLGAVRWCIPPFVPAAGGLLVKPDRRQILIDVVAWADLPALYVRPIRDDPVVPGRHQHMRLDIEHVFFEFTHQGALLGRIGLVQHLLIEIDLLLVLIVTVVLGVNRTWQKLTDVE